MKVASAFHAGDRARALTWLQWITELGGCQRHEIILVPAKDVADYKPLRDEAAKAFGKVSVLPDGEGVTGWPQGPNSNIRQLVWHLWHLHLGPVLHLENDCIPLVPDWLDRIEAEYLSAGKPFMGALVQPGDGTPDHITGNMVMPWNAVILAPMLSNRGMSVTREELAFDITAAPQILPLAQLTSLIQQVFNVNGECPTFSDQASLAIINNDAVLFHRNKDESLIQRLSEKKTGRSGYTAVPAITISGRGVTSSANVRVFTYFSPVESEEGQTEQQRILAIWKETWAANGWEPVVLTEEDAKKHLKYDEWKSVFSTFPTVNSDGYELACYLRWVAMACLPMCNLLTDYDCLPFGFRPSDIPEIEPGTPPIILSKAPAVPFAVIGSQKHYDTTVEYFLAGGALALKAEPRKHISDMMMLQKLKGVPTAGIGLEYKTDGWETAKLVHFGHCSCHPRKRSEVMTEVLAGRTAPKAQASSPIMVGGHFSELIIDGCADEPEKLKARIRELEGLIEAESQRKRDVMAKARAARSLKPSKIVAGKKRK